MISNLLSFIINSDNNFTIVANPSESKDINQDIENELLSITDLIDSCFTLKGPYRNRNVTKIELIRLMGSTSLFHFSGHYDNKDKISGWKLEDDIFSSKDIDNLHHAPDFIFSNTIFLYCIIHHP